LDYKNKRGEKKMKQKSIKIIKGILMIVGVVVVILTGVNFIIAKFGTTDVTFKLNKITRTNFEQTISSTGTMEAVGTVDVGTQTSGTIAKVYVDYNSIVKKGQVLAELDDSLFIAEVNNAKASLIKAKAALKKAKADFLRNKKLFQKGHISEEDFIDTETEYNKCRADVLSAESSLDKAEINLSYTIIKSPIDGTIVEKSIEAGQTVAASYSTPTLFIIAEDLSKMQIEADVDESDIGVIKKGQPVRFSVQAYPDNMFNGIVSQIRMNPETISNVVTYTVVVDADNNDHLLMPGMTATADFIIYLEKNVVVVPNAALKFRPPPEYIKKTTGKPGKNHIEKEKISDIVFLYDGTKTLKPIKVTKGKSENGVTIITQGLNAGDKVVTSIETKEKKTKKSGVSMLIKSGPGSGRGGRLF